MDITLLHLKSKKDGNYR